MIIVQDKSGKTLYQYHLGELEDVLDDIRMKHVTIIETTINLEHKSLIITIQVEGGNKWSEHGLPYYTGAGN